MERIEASGKRSLNQLILLAVCGILVALLLGNLISTAIITRDHVQARLHSHAQDAATSLGLSISTLLANQKSKMSAANVQPDGAQGDDVLAARMIDAVFDSGDFENIILISSDGRLVHKVQREGVSASVPGWFKALFEIKLAPAAAQVMVGWAQYGELILESRTDLAYSELWQTAKSQFIWFVLVLVLSLGLVYLMLARLLRSLRDVEFQSRQMSNKQFDYRLDEPSTRELASVAAAMNDMAATLGEVYQGQLGMIEGLRAEARMDAVSGLYNRSGFDARLDADLDPNMGCSQGTLMLLQIRDFAQFNEVLGRDQGDEVLSSVAQALQSLAQRYEAGYAGRRAGADFCVFFPNVVEDQLVEEFDRLIAKLSGMAWARQTLTEGVLCLGVAGQAAGDNSRELLSKADFALREAQAKGVSTWCSYAGQSGESGVDVRVKQASDWRVLIDHALSSDGFEVYVQSVMSVSGEELSRQVLARMRVDGELVSASEFIPMAQRFSLMSAIDKSVIVSILQQLPELTGTYSVSISEGALRDEAFMAWLEQAIHAQPDLFARIVFSVPEYALLRSEKQVQILIGLAASAATNIMVERFGASSVPFSYLQNLNLAAIKLDHGFVSGIHQNQEAQFFVRSAIQLAHSQGVKVYAVGVEDDLDRSWLVEAGVDGVLGFVLDRPKPLMQQVGE